VNLKVPGERLPTAPDRYSLYAENSVLNVFFTASLR